MTKTRRHQGRKIRQIVKLDQAWKAQGGQPGRIENDLAFRLGQAFRIENDLAFRLGQAFRMGIGPEAQRARTRAA